MPWLERAMARNPTAPETHRAAARCLANVRKTLLAKREYRLAYVYGDTSALAEAHVMFPRRGELLDVAPDTPDGLISAAQVLRDDPPDAVDALRRAWESFHATPALALLASAELAQNNPEEALRVARLLQAEDKLNSAGYTFAARALDALGRSPEAMKELEVGAARVAGDPDVLVPLGERLLAERRFSQARSIFESIVARNGFALAGKHVLVAAALEGQGRLGEALRHAQTARDIAPSDPGVLVTFARCAAAVGRFDEAIEALETATTLSKGAPGEYDVQIRKLRSLRDEQNARRAAGASR
jgi:tetratricopeptide (TPR) repeat protein